MANHKRDMIGKRVGKLVVIKELEKRASNGSVVWLCKCDCGNTKEVSSKNLFENRISSCGCLKSHSKTHGLSNHPLYYTWKSMIRRCYNPEDARFQNYGARGITVCDE